MWEKEKMLVTSIFSFTPEKNSCFKVTFILSSANAFNLDQSKNLLFGKELTLYHIIPYLTTPNRKAFWKHCGKRRECWQPAFSPFSTMFYTLHKTNFKFSVMFILSSAHALTHSHTKTPFDAPGKQGFWKHCGKRRNCSKGEIAHNEQFLLFSTVFSTRLDNFLPFSSNLKLSSANSFSLEESKICCLVMG